MKVIAINSSPREGGNTEIMCRTALDALAAADIQTEYLYWNLGIGREPGEVSNDDEGMRTMTRLGENMAWALGRLGQ
jgi:multimeric flavodoxin WrbA